MIPTTMSLIEKMHDNDAHGVMLAGFMAGLATGAPIIGGLLL